MTTSTTTQTKLGLGAASVIWMLGAVWAAGCTGSQSKPDEPPAGEADRKADSEPTAQGPTQKRPGPVMIDGEPEVEERGSADGITEWKVGGLTVIHKPTPANSVVSAKLFIDGGVAKMSDESAGLEKLALRLATNGGTESTPKDQFTSTLNSMGSSVGSFTGRDYSGYDLRCIRKHFDATWDLFVEAVLEPAMPEGELSVQRDRQLAEIAKRYENPNQLVSYTTRQLMAEGHPYERMQTGTEQNVEDFTRQQVVDYHEKLLNPQRMVLVVVGDIDEDTLLEKVKSKLGRLKPGKWSPPSVKDLPDYRTRLEGVEKDIDTNYILGAFRAPQPGHDDYPALKLATAYLSDKLFEEIRTKRRLSYAVASGLSMRRANHGYLYVSAEQPNKTMKVILDEVETLKESKLEADQLKRTRNVFITEQYMNKETNAKQASALGSAQLTTGDWRYEFELVEAVDSVTPEDVRRVAQKYMQNYQFGVVGSPDTVDKNILGIESSNEE